jgi:hypothetical protein
VTRAVLTFVPVAREFWRYGSTVGSTFKMWICTCESRGTRDETGLGGWRGIIQQTIWPNGSRQMQRPPTRTESATSRLYLPSLVVVGPSLTP